MQPKETQMVVKLMLFDILTNLSTSFTNKQGAVPQETTHNKNRDSKQIARWAWSSLRWLEDHMVQNLWCEKAEFASSRDDDGYGDQVESGINYHWVGRYIYTYCTMQKRHSKNTRYLVKSNTTLRRAGLKWYKWKWFIWSKLEGCKQKDWWCLKRNVTPGKFTKI